MKLDQIEITHFEKGMVESMELGQSFNNQYSAPVVKYLENLTPNMIQGALVKRLNYTTFGLVGATTTSEGPIPQSDQYSNNIYLDYAGKRYIQGYWPHKYIRVPDPTDPDFRIYVHMLTGQEVQQDPLYSSLLSRHLSMNLVGMERFDMRNPVAGNVYVAMLRDDITIEGQRYATTSINGYYYSKALTNKASSGEGWLNPLYDPEYFELQGNQFVGVPFGRKGSRVNGIAQDWIVVGQALYIVSIPGKENKLLPALPVYRWSPIATNETTKISSVFSVSPTNRTYYLISADTGIACNSITLLTPYAEGPVKNHPQYKGQSDVSFSENTVDVTESIDFDGVKNTVDILWWQTNKLPKLKGITNETIQDVLTTSTPATQRLKDMQAEWHTVDTASPDVDAAYVVKGTNGSLIRVPAMTPLSQSGIKSPVTYYETLLPELTGMTMEKTGSGNDRDMLIGHLRVYDSCPHPTNGINTYYAGHLGQEDPDHFPHYGRFDNLENLEWLLTSHHRRHRARIKDPTLGPDSPWLWRAVMTNKASSPLEYWFSVKQGGVVRYHKIVPHYFRHAHKDVNRCTYVNWLTEVGLVTGGNVSKTLLFRMKHNYGDDWIQSLFLSASKDIEPNKKRVLNYAKIDAPRIWNPGDKIPYMLTAVLDGVEYVVKQDTYVVDYGNASASIVDKPTNKAYFAYSNIMAFEGGQQWSLTDPDIVLPETDQESLINQFPFVCFSLRFNIPQGDDLFQHIPQGISSFKLYVSNPDPATSSFFYTEGSEWAVDIYRRPLVKDSVSRAYGLVKEFLVREDLDLQKDGTETDFAGFGIANQGTTSVAHGKWSKFPNPEPFIQQEIGSPQLSNSGGSGFYYIPYKYSEFSKELTPDFYLWDYASGPALTDNLRNLSVSWDGIGARCITQVSNRIVIGGTIDKDGSEEIGRIRASAVQGTTMLNTVFAELDALDVSSTPIYALLNFRNDLWVFSRNSIVRINPSNPYDMATWQIIDTVTGQGIQNRKHVVQTPTGIFFANTTGLWFANGSEIKNVSLPVTQSYKMLYDQYNAEWQGYNKYTLMPHMGAYNDSFELSYSPQNNEVVLSARAYRSSDNLADVPGNGNIDLQMRYSIDLDNWYVVSVDLPPGRYLNQTFAHSAYGRVRFIDSDGKLVMPILYDRSLAWAKQSNGYYDDMTLAYLYDRIEGLMFPQNSQFFQMLTYAWRTWYAGWVTLHEIGDGLDDYLLRQVMVEAVPIEHTPFQLQTGMGAPQITWRDPKLFIQYRNRENRNWTNAPELAPVPFPTDAGTYDLVELNSRLVANPDIYWSHLNMPISRAFSRESLVLNTPLDSKFRRLEATFVTTSLSYLKGFRFKFAKFIRKTFG